jgi:hypothetical protein
MDPLGPIKGAKMRYQKTLGLVTAAALSLTLLFGGGTAAATKLYRYTTPSPNDALSSQTYNFTITPGFSFLVKDTAGVTMTTCTSFTDHGHLTAAGGLEPTSFVYTGCTDSTIVVLLHTLEIKHIAGTTNGTMVSKGGEVTIQSTIFGLSCIAKTGAGTTIGTLTGAKSSTGSATIDYNGVVPMGICGDAIFSGSGIVSSPQGLTVEAS